MTIAEVKKSTTSIVGILSLCAITMIVDGYDVQSLGLAVPALSQAFGVSPSDLAPAMSASLLGMAFGAVVLAPWGDRLGLRVVGSAVLVLMGTSMLLTATSTGPVSLAMWRFLTGVGMGAIAPLVVTLAASYAPLRWRTVLVTLVIVSMGLGSTIASFVAPLIESRLGWRGIFLLGGVLPLVVAAGFLVFAPARALHSKKQPDGERLAVSSLFQKGLRRRTTLLWLILLLNQSVVYALIGWLPALLELVGWDRADAQRGTGLLAIGGVLGGLVVAWLADRGKAAPASAITYVIGTLALLLLLADDISPAEWHILLLLTGVSAIGTMSAMGSLAAIYYPASIRATGVGWASGVGRIGGLLGPLGVAGAIEMGLPAALVLPLLAVPLLLCALCACGLRQEQLARD